MALISNDGRAAFSSISQLQIENFKSIQKTSIAMAPLTILIGVNSRGKSTILQSILLVAQSVGKTKLGEVSLNGEAVTLGTSDEVFRKSRTGRVNRQATIGIEVTLGHDGTKEDAPLSMATRVTQRFLLDRTLKRSRKGVVAAREFQRITSRIGKRDETERVRLDREMTNSLGHPVFEVNKSRIKSQSDFSRRATPLDRAQRIFLIDSEEGRNQFSDRVFLLDTLQLLQWNLDSNPIFNRKRNSKQANQDGTKGKKPLSPSGKALQGALEKTAISFHEYFITQATQSEATRDRVYFVSPPNERVFREWLSHNDDQEFRSVIDTLLSENGKKILEDFAKDKDFMHQKFLVSTIGDFDEIKFLWQRQLGNRVNYLGPLREKDALSSVGKLDFSELTPLGPKAEYLADFVFEMQSEQVTFPLPSSTAATSQSFFRLLEAWTCEYFQLGQSLSIIEEGRFGPVLRVDGSRLLHLGTGVSQLLPVIALCLKAKPGTTIILEQPELHLHPGLQQKLGTFLAVVSSTGRQVIVETHSEYLLTRVRRHIAEEHISEDSCTLVFVQDDGSVVQRPALTGGDLDDWPEQFIDHSLDDAIAIASLREN